MGVQVARACDRASECKDHLAAAQDLAEEAHDLLARALRGAVGSESAVEQLLATFAAVVDGTRTAWRHLSRAKDHADAVLHAITGTAPDAGVPIAPPPVPLDRIERLRRELPPHRRPGGPRLLPPYGCISRGSETAAEPPIYYFTGSDTEYPPDAEIPLDDVRRAAHEFMRTGSGRPGGIVWQPRWGAE